MTHDKFMQEIEDRQFYVLSNNTVTFTTSFHDAQTGEGKKTWRRIEVQNVRVPLDNVNTDEVREQLALARKTVSEITPNEALNQFFDLDAKPLELHQLDKNTPDGAYYATLL